MKYRNYTVRIWHSFEEWSDRGYRICRGEKAQSRDQYNLPLFGEHQVIPLSVYEKLPKYQQEKY